MKSFKKVRFATNRHLPADQYKCVAADCSATHRFLTTAELRCHIETHKKCDYCQKTFIHRRHFKEHVKQDKECNKIKRTLRKMVQIKAIKLAKSFLEDEYDSSSDSGLGTSSNSSSISEHEPSIRMTFGKSKGDKYEVVMASEKVHKEHRYRTNILKERKVTHDNISNPMVTIKTEVFKDFLNVKEEEMEYADINDLLEDSEAEDTKPPIPTPNNSKGGIRLTIDKKAMSVAMTSEMPHPSHSAIDSQKDVKPTLADLEKQIQPGIKMIIGKDTMREEFSVLLESELVPGSSANKHKCENLECSKIGSHICVYPKFRQMPGLVKTKGILNLKKSFRKRKSRFSIFNKSFYRQFGCIFYFKAHNGHIEVRSTSKKVRHTHRCKLSLYQAGFETGTVCTLGGNKYKSSSAIPTDRFTGDFIKYKIVIYAVP